jgi:hypothetical protein
MKLYHSRQYPKRWYAFSNSVGWVMFPAETNGWEKRQPARGIDPIDLRQVPVELAFDAGIPGSPTASVDHAEAA